MLWSNRQATAPLIRKPVDRHERATARFGDKLQSSIRLPPQGHITRVTDRIRLRNPHHCRYYMRSRVY